MHRLRSFPAVPGGHFWCSAGDNVTVLRIEPKPKPIKLCPVPKDLFCFNLCTIPSDLRATKEKHFLQKATESIQVCPENFTHLQESGWRK